MAEPFKPDDDPRTTPSPQTTDLLLWLIIPAAILVAVLVFLLGYLTWRCCRHRQDSKGVERSPGGRKLRRFPPSSSNYERLSITPSVSSTSSGSEGYGSLQHYGLVLGRNATSMHEIKTPEEIHFLDFEGDGDGSAMAGSRGQILVTFKISQSGGLSVTIHGITDLSSYSHSPDLDTYVQLRLLPAERGEVQELSYRTTIRRKTRNPVFEETFSFDIEVQDIFRCDIQFVVISHPKFSPKRVIGERQVSLQNVPTAKEFTESYSLQSSVQKSRGQILLSLSYLPTSQRLLLGVVRARDLNCGDESREIDPCVRASLILGGRKFRRKKTAVKESEQNPVFNDKFFFAIEHEKLHRVQILVSVTNERDSGQDSDTDTGSLDHEVGQVLLGYRSAPRAHHHWQKTLENPRETYAQWYELTA
ncbi:synaptotagmin-1-like [Diadema antillarum]|uniref:synaptotagmin-1-like n=1 Tax=Diadema antillarum TaxID=105358 RepID=UPI003A86C7A9